MIYIAYENVDNRVGRGSLVCFSYTGKKWLFLHYLIECFSFKRVLDHNRITFVWFVKEKKSIEAYELKLSKTFYDYNTKPHI